MVKISKKIPLLIFTAIIIVALGWLTTGAINKNDKKRLEGYANEAQNIGLERLQKECIKEKLNKSICDNLEVSTDTTECGGRTCWIVYAQSKGPEYAAGATVIKQNDRYVVIDYLRNPGTQE